MITLQSTLVSDTVRYGVTSMSDLTALAVECEQTLDNFTDPEPGEPVVPEADFEDAVSALNNLRDFVTDAMGTWPGMVSDALDSLDSNGASEIIPEGDFTDYVRDMVADCGYLPADLPWWVTVDWEDTADNVRVDYSTVTLNGDRVIIRSV